MEGGVDKAVGVPGREGSAEFTTVDVGVSVMIAPERGREVLRSTQDTIEVSSKALEMPGTVERLGAGRREQTKSSNSDKDTPAKCWE